MKNILRLFYIIAFSILITGINYHALYSASKGQIISNVKIKDANNNPAWIPFFTKKVLIIFYTDPDVKNVNDPLSSAIIEQKFDGKKYQGIGIANSKDTWMPDAAIRMVARSKMKQFPGAIVMVDEGKIVSKKWNLGDCNDSAILIVIGIDKRVKFIDKVNCQSKSREITPEVIRIIEQEIKKIK